MGEGDTFEFYVKLYMSTSSAQFGGVRSGESILVGWKNPDTTVFEDDDFSLEVTSGGVTLTPVECSKYPNADSTLDLDRCWIMDKAIGDRDKDESNAVGNNIWLFGSLRSSKGDPGATDDAIIRFVDIHEFWDSTKQAITVDGYDSDSNDIGETNIAITLDLS
jgi:hypothetical protein